MKVLLVKSGQKPEVKEIDGSIKSMQELVGGYIEQIMPFKDGVALICNEKDNMGSFALNRAIFDDTGEITNIIAGDFFVCYAPIESRTLLGLSDELVEKYAKLFRYPETFSIEDGHVTVYKKYETRYKL